MVLLTIIWGPYVRFRLRNVSGPARLLVCPHRSYLLMGLGVPSGLSFLLLWGALGGGIHAGRISGLRV